MFQENQSSSVRPELVEGRKPTINIKPILIFGYGNLSRGDDALGPLLLQTLEESVNPDTIEILTDFQLQIEHALDLEKRQLVLFVDASVSCVDAFDFTELSPARDNSYTTHAMSPSAVLSVYQEIKKQAPPPCFLLSIKGVSFELGESLSDIAEANLKHATKFLEQLSSNYSLTAWQQLLKLSPSFRHGLPESRTQGCE